MTNPFSVPDKERNYQGYMVYMLAIIWTIAICVIVSVGFFFFPQIWQRWLSLFIVSILIAFINLTLNSLGYIRLASWCLTIMLWLVITIPCYTAGGMMAPGILSQLSVILTAGFLLGWKGGLFIGLLTICADFGLAYLEQAQLLPIPSVVHTPITRWIGAIIPLGTILALQYYSTNHLRTGLMAMQREIIKSEEAEKTKDQTLNTLKERIKELKTLYAVSQILQNEKTPYQILLAKIADILPGGWQYPEITAARACVAGSEYTSHHYRASEYSQLEETKTDAGNQVLVEIVYLEPKPDLDEGPFLKEERNLIHMVTEMIKSDLERRNRKIELNDYKYALDNASLVSISDVNGYFTFVNENFCKTSKYSAEELTGKHHSIIWSGIHSSEYFEDLTIKMQKGTPYRGEFCNKAKDGSFYWVATSIVPFLDEKGNVYQYLSINQDITRQKNAEYLIKEQAETFRAIIENTKESIYLLSPDFQLLQFNKTAKERILRARNKELYLGADFREFLFPETTDVFNSMFKDALKGINRTEEVRALGENGEYIWFQSKTSPVYDTHGELIGVTLLAEGIDDRKKAETVLRESEEKFRSIVEQSLVGIYIIQNGKLIYTNPGFEKILGYSNNELFNKMSLEDLAHEDDYKEVQSIFNKKINLQHIKEQYTFRAIRNDGAVLHLEVIASLISYNNQPAIIGTLVDITARIEEERRINKAVLDAQENERLQIGMELHDNVKQILAASALFLDMAQKKLDDKTAINAILNDLKKYNIEAITELRRLSHQLAPLIEENTDIGQKINWLIKSLNLDETISTTIYIEDFKKPLDNNTQLLIYRILQEQLSNIIKYAKASRVEIKIHTTNDLLFLQVNDNGIGFDVNAKKNGIGLENIRRRVMMLNGKLEMISSPGQGCKINVQVPFSLTK